MLGVMLGLMLGLRNMPNMSTRW